MKLSQETITQLPRRGSNRIPLEYNSKTDKIICQVLILRPSYVLEKLETIFPQEITELAGVSVNVRSQPKGVKPKMRGVGA